MGNIVTIADWIFLLVFSQNADSCVRVKSVNAVSLLELRQIARACIVEIKACLLVTTYLHCCTFPNCPSCSLSLFTKNKGQRADFISLSVFMRISFAKRTNIYFVQESQRALPTGTQRSFATPQSNRLDP
jgi:hypothetical protein